MQSRRKCNNININIVTGCGFREKIVEIALIVPTYKGALGNLQF